MGDAVRAALVACDEFIERDAPPGFELETAREEVRAFSRHACLMTGLTFEMDDQVQDAPYFAGLFAISEHGLGVAIRFSAFGRLVLAYVDPMVQDKRAWTGVGFPGTLTDLLSACGYTVFSPEDVRHPYDGNRGDLHGRFSWLERYFDYS